MLNNFGAAYTLKGLDDEPFLELQCMQICLSATSKAQEMAHKKEVFYSKEGLSN